MERNLMENKGGGRCVWLNQQNFKDPLEKTLGI